MHLANLHKDVTAMDQERHLLVRIDTSLTVSNADRIRNEIMLAWDEHPDAEAIILDLDGVAQMDSSGVGVLMELANRTEKAGVPLRVCCLQKGPLGLLQRTRLNRMFQISKTVQEASRDIPQRHAVRLPPAARRCTRIDDAETPRHSHRVLWTLTLVILVALVAGGTYGFMAVNAYHGKMNLFPSMQANLVAAGQKIDAAQNSIGNWTADRGQWLQRAGAKIDAVFHGMRQQANNLTHGRQQQQVHQLQNSHAEQPNVDESMTGGANDRERKEFTLPVRTEQEVAPGVWIGFTNTDVTHQRYDGRLRLMAAGRAIGIHSQAIGQPLEFSLAGDNARAELVVTSVTSGSVSGYVLLSRRAAAAVGAD